MRKMFGAIAIVLGMFFGLYGQDGTVGPDPNFEQAKIVKTPMVQVPKEAIESGLGGTVRVLVSIDEAGNVTSADDATGPGAVCKQVTRADVVAMRAAAKEASMLAKFSPAKKNGLPAPSSIWLNFNFKGKDSSENSLVAGNEDLTRYKVKGDNNFSAANTLPPDYKGPVSGAATSEVPTSASNVDATSASKLISGGVLNGKAERLPNRHTRLPHGL